MAANSIADAVISLGVAPNTQLAQQVTGVVKQINSLVTQGLSVISSVVAPTIGIALAGITRGFALEIEKIGIAADRLNMPVEQMDAWTGAANMAGISTDTLIGSMDALHNAMVSAARFEGGGLLKEMMRGYMPQVGDMDAVEQYMLGVANAVEHLDKVTAHRELSKIGIGDPKLQRWLMQGSEALKVQIELSRKLGVISEEDRRIADRMNFSMRAMQRAFERSLLPIFRLLAPAMEKVSMTLLYLRDHWEAFVPALVYGATKLTMAFVRMGIAFTATHPIITATVLALAKLGTMFEDLVVWIEGGNVAHSDLWKSIFGSPEELNSIIDSIKGAWKLLTDDTSSFTFSDFVRLLAFHFENIFGDKIKEFLKTLKSQPWKQIFKDILTTATQAVKEFFEVVKEWFKSVNWRELFINIYDVLTTIFTEFLNAVKELFSSIDWESVLEGLKDAFASVDWKALLVSLVQSFVNIFRSLCRFIANEIKQVDWKAVFKFIGLALITIFAAALDAIKALITDVDWSGAFADLMSVFDSMGFVGTILKVVAAIYILRKAFAGFVFLKGLISGIIEHFVSVMRRPLQTLGLLVRNIKKAFVTLSLLRKLQGPIGGNATTKKWFSIDTEAHKRAIKNIFKSIPSYFEGLGKSIGKLFTTIGTKLKALGPIISAFGAKIWAAMAPLLPWLAILGVVLGAGYLAFKNQDKIVANTLKEAKVNELDVDNTSGAEDLTTDRAELYKLGKESIQNYDNSITVNVGSVNSDEQAQNVANRVAEAQERPRGRFSNETTGGISQGG